MVGLTLKPAADDRSTSRLKAATIGATTRRAGEVTNGVASGPTIQELQQIEEFQRRWSVVGDFAEDVLAIVRDRLGAKQ